MGQWFAQALQSVSVSAALARSQAIQAHSIE